jgi:prepilin-type N-terminal cleavage/methylation domain-containing protein
MKKNVFGFTMIELVISLAIFALLSGGAFVYMGNFNDRKNLDLAVDEVVSDIGLARVKAITAQSPEGVGTGFELKTVGVEAGESKVNLIVYGENTAGEKVNYWAKELNQGVQIKNISGDGTLRFSLFDGRIKNEVKIVLEMKNTGDTRTIVIDTYGKIQ